MGRQPSAALLGACAAGLSLAAMVLLRAATGLPALNEVVGDALVLFIPGRLFGTLIDAFQERGRPLLLLGTSLAILVVGALLGRALAAWSWPRARRQPATPARRRGHPLGRWLLPGLGLWVLTLPLVAVGEGGVLRSATWSTLLDWLILTGVLELLLGLPLRQAVRPAPLDPGEPGLRTRRRFLAQSGAALGAATIGYLGWEVLSAAAPPVAGAGALPSGRLPGEITPTSDFYIVSKDLFGPPQVDPASWRLRVEGRRPFTLSYSDLLAEPHLTRVQTLECISNPVGGTLISNGIWRGVQLSRLLERAGMPGDTVGIVFGCADGYTESLPLAQAVAPTTLLADHLNGHPLRADHGFPARILVVDHYGMKNPKWLTSMAPTSQPYYGYWEQQGWDAGAYPRIFSRFDFPAANTALASGHRYLLTGVAYAGTRGISAVEVSLDGTRHWAQARLAPPASPYTWTRWSYSWTPAGGYYTLAVRARDGRGTYQQSGLTSTFPSGASAYQVLTVIAR
ncbi:MAG: molybdopterin-dependent oxidoreductase [Candidatus Dormibacteria bacterium]